MWKLHLSKAHRRASSQRILTLGQLLSRRSRLDWTRLTILEARTLLTLEGMRRVSLTLTWRTSSCHPLICKQSIRGNSSMSQWSQVLTTASNSCATPPGTLLRSCMALKLQSNPPITIWYWKRITHSFRRNLNQLLYLRSQILSRWFLRTWCPIHHN